jgi:glycosyltransferase involved in cell wall biosynthesis
MIKETAIKVLFLIHDLGVGGAEKVLVSLVNHMDRSKYDISVIALFGGGVNEQFLALHIHYHAVWKKTIPGNSKIMKLLTPQQLHRLCVKKHYDVEVAYLEGPSARIISGCSDPKTKLFGWIHIEQHTEECAARAFRSFAESERCYERFDQIICVSETVRQDFLRIYPGVRNVAVRYNTIETDKIQSMKQEAIEDVIFREAEMNLVAVGKISKNKGVDRLARIVKRLRDAGLPVHLYALGVGEDQAEIETWLRNNNLTDYFTFLGYRINPYKYVAKCDLFVCASLAEGFSTAATEALIVGTPVCTVEVSGMREMLGEHDEYGIVTENDENSLYEGIMRLLKDPGLLAYYRQQAEKRGKSFSTEHTVKAVEDILKG